MRAFLIIACAVLTWAPAGRVDAQEAPKKSPELVRFTSAQSQTRLARSKHKVDFFALANQFEPQMNGGTCGPTSAVIVLNTLRPPDDARRPVDRSAFPYVMRMTLPEGREPVKPRYTQRAFFDAHFTKVKSLPRFYGAPDAEGTRDFGLQLRQLHDILVQNGLDVTLRVVADDLPERQIRKELIDNLAHPGDYVIVNYQRSALGQPGGGHISPVGAYDAKSDSFLILDVNPNRAPWVWVPAKLLIAAMRTKDTIENRGYLLVKEGK